MLKSVWIVFGFVFLCGMARADDFCELKRAAVLDSKVEGSVHLMLPATFGTRQTRLLLDTGGAWSIMRASLAKELGYAPKKLRTIYYLDVAGGRTTHYVTAPRFTLGGQLTLGESDFLLEADDDAEGLDAYGGTLGAERLTDYDVEIDSATKAVTLYRSDKFCSGRLVRWTDKWVEIPYTFNNEMLETKVRVGSDRIRAVFDTGSTKTLMDFDVARDLFGVGPSSPGVDKESEITMPSGKKLQLYSYHVKSLTVSDLTFDDVEVYLGDYKDFPFVLGMHEIGQLHLYIASKRKIIYATRIDPAK
jgi:predicted aspartyl protease